MSRIGCGNCGGQHDSVDQIRQCYAGTLDTGRVKTEEAPSEKQLNLAHMLARQNERLPEYAALTQADYEDTIQAMGRRTISKFIGAMKDQPKLNKEPANWQLPHPEVLPGKYALERDGKIYFWSIMGEKDTREGERILLAMHGSPGEYTYTRVRSSKVAAEVMEAIAANPLEALIRFGQESMICGLCGSPLTNEVSRAEGIGPVCRNKL